MDDTIDVFVESAGGSMTTSRFLLALTLAIVGTTTFASDELGEILLADLEGMQLSLEGSPYYYWLTPENGRILLKKQCAPDPEDCDRDVVVIWSQNGSKLFDRTPRLDIPDLSGFDVRATALLGSDRLYLSAAIRRNELRWAVALYDIGAEELVAVIPTHPIRCRDLTGDSRGTLWCLGDDFAKHSNQEDFDLVYLFDHAGKLQGSTLRRSAYPEEPHPLTRVRTQSGYGGFLPGDGPVRLWLPDHGELVSFDDDGEVAARLDLPKIADQRRAWLVSAPGGRVYSLLTRGADPEKPRDWTQALHRLSSDGSQWVPLHDPPTKLPKRIRLVGADEKGLVLLDRRSLTLYWWPIDE
jgi:hypothetical protein